MLNPKTFLLTAAITLTSIATASAQGRPANNPREDRGKTRVEEIQQRISARASQRAEQQLQRRSAEQGRRIGQRRAEEMSRRASIAGKRISESRVRTETAVQHADLHSAIAEARVSGKPVRLNEKQREVVADVFGDASVLDPPDLTDNEDGDRPAKIGRLRLPGSQANPNARLANAIRVRQTKISELRDLALETNDERLLEKADFFEQKLQKFIDNQARVEAKLVEAAKRARPDLVIDSVIDEPISDDSLIESDTTIRTAEVDSNPVSDDSAESRVE